ncbi:MAG: hypothetical protein KGM17_07610 [Sphingomonadales bacterium]|nr:hypothetical protein [Sphingomonadales bacterium]
MLLRKIEKFLRESGMPPSLFGRMAANDPRLVGDLRNGRTPRAALESRVEHFMNLHRRTPS